MAHNGKVVIGLGGNIGAGKTTAAKIFEELGAHYISADEIGWQVLTEIKESLCKKFGEQIKKGDEIDKERLRDIVFYNPEALDYLNRLSHPLLIKKIKKRLNSIKEGFVVLDAALLFDWPEVLKEIDYPILITADKVHKEERADKKGISKEVFNRILSVQDDERAMSSQAKFIIENNGTLTELKKECQKIYEEIRDDC